MSHLPDRPTGDEAAASAAEPINSQSDDASGFSANGNSYRAQDEASAASRTSDDGDGRNSGNDDTGRDSDSDSDGDDVGDEDDNRGNTGGGNRGQRDRTLRHERGERHGNRGNERGRGGDRPGNRQPAPGRDQHDHDEYMDEEEEAAPTPAAPEPDEYILPVRMSRSLYKKLQYTSQDEMVSIDDFACELLAEGLVLRAWEIMERKSAMRGGGPGHGVPHGNSRHGGGGGGDQRHGGAGNHQGGGNKGGGGGRQHHRGNRQNTRAQNHANTLNLMEDKAAFLEYVRNQERKRR